MAYIFNPALQNTLKLPIRRAWIEIKKLDEKAVQEMYYFDKLDGLNIKFSVTSCGKSFPRAKIGICNLSQDTIDWLINYFQVPTSQELLNHVIRLYIGYNDIVNCIFEGTVVKTSLTAPPDMWFNFEAIFRYDALIKNISISLSNEVTIKQVYEEVAKALNMSLDWQASSNKKVTSFVYDKSANKILDELSRLDSSVGNYIYGQFSGDNNGVIRCFDIPNEDNNSVELPQWSKEHYISARTGMLGVPQFNPLGCDIDCVLNPDINFLDTILLDSIYQRKGNGKYKIYQVTHTGESRGNNFKTNIKASTLYGRNNDSSVKN